MSCIDCFNGCTEIISDKCIKYTGIDIPGLGIENGDNLLVVENKITEKILTLMDGSGIIPKLDPNDVCAVVQSFLPCCPPLNLNVVLTAFLKAICDIDSRLGALKDRIIVVEDALVALNADYNVGDCLTGVTASSDTHDVVQAVIDSLCALVVEVHTKYVLLSDLDELIEQFMSDLPTSDKYSNKMVPYVPVPYFGPLTGFDVTGAGSGVWDRVFLCNGQNPGVPDLRGRIIVGATTMSNATFNQDVDPNLPGNPTYNGYPNPTLFGQNTVTLSIAQLADHTHETTVTITDNGHVHPDTKMNPAGGAPPDIYNYNSVGDQDHFNVMDSGVGFTNLKGNGNDPINPNVVVENEPAGNGAPHINVQPSIGANFIIFIPL